MATLIETLHQTERRLEELTGGEVDTVSSGSGRPFVLRRAQEQLQRNDAARQNAILNALPAHIAMLDAQGTIVSVNEAWRQFGRANLSVDPGLGVGLNYLDVCDRARGPRSTEAHEVAAGIRAVLGGAAPSFSIEYPCHGPAEQRWFLLMVTPVTGPHPHGAVVMHLNITERRRAVQELRESEARFSGAFVQAPSGVALVAPDGRWLKVNQAICDLLGYPEAELLTRTFQDITHPEDLAAELEHVRHLIAGEIRTYQMEKRYIRAHGGLVTVLLNVSLVRDGSGQPVYFISHIQDISARKQAELMLQREQALLSSLLSTIPDHIYVKDRQSRFIRINNSMAQRMGLRDPGAAIGKSDVDFFTAEHAQPAFQQEQDMMATGESIIAVEEKETWTDGLVTWASSTKVPLRNPAGEIVGLIGVSRDITERREVLVALRESNEKFSQLADNITDAFWIRSPDMKHIYYVSPAFEKIWGRSVASLLAHPHQWIDFVLGEDRARVQGAFDALTDGSATLEIEYRIVRPSGEIRWVLVRGFQVRNSTDQPLRHIGIVTDITERKKVEADLQEKTALLEAQLNSTLDGILVVDGENRKILQNQRCIELWQIPPEIVRQNDEKQVQFVMTRTKHPRQFADKIRHLYTHPDEISRDEIELVDGTVLDRYSAPVKGKEGRYYGRIWTFRNITQRKQADDALRESEQRFKTLFEQAAVGVALVEVATGCFVQANQRFCDITGRTRQELKQLTFTAITHPQDQNRDLELMGQLKAGALREYSREKRYQRPDGAESWVSVTISAMWPAGEPPGLCIGIVQDITARKHVEEHLLQAQKMEALGQFSGGVAHDFNNILAAISGYTELARMQLEGAPKVREHLDAVIKAANRAADLVRQILTFSRQQKQTREVLLLQAIVVESMKLMRATIPSTVQIEALIASDAPTVLANANQVHQVLMNLAINGWHALKNHPGQLQVKLEKVAVDAAFAAENPELRPGTYASLSVSDTGCGMDQATLRRVFEPFFTTKPVGEGTGLGLAVVHGIIDSHDGAVTVHSQPGEGTTFRLYFPEHVGDTTAGQSEAGPTPRGQGERVLVVDDEDMLAEMGANLLDRLGYTAESTTSCAQALELVRADPSRFALVLTDQTMPGMTGLQLATQLREIRPDLPLILMSGYNLSLTTDRVGAPGIGNILQKPFTLHSLGLAVHATLAGKSHAPHGTNPPY